MTRRGFGPIVILVVLIGWTGLEPTARAGGGGWVVFVDDTGTRLVADPALGVDDPEEKDYAWGDLDHDGDLDVVCVRKEPFTSAGRRRNVLFMNEGVAQGHAINGVLVDRTTTYALDTTDGGQGFLDLTNDRDVVMTDVNADGWLDVVTATTISDGLPKSISHPRVYLNKQSMAGVWQGLRYEEARIPQLTTIGTNTPVAPRFCAVAAGDLTGDDRPDLYFVDYDDSGAGGSDEPPGVDLNDRLLINDGSGNFTDSRETRMSAAMLVSAFGMATVIADMNGDGVNDVVKDSALDFPQRITILYNNPANEGFFNAFENVYTQSPYHVTVGDLNQDTRLDLIATDDGQDRYLLNQGNGGDGLANFTSFPFTYDEDADDGFGGDNFIADLNNDGHNDVLITDVDVDIDGCGRRLHIYRNLGNLPNVTLQEQGGEQGWTPHGVHDLAIFDLNGDGWKDLLIGTCTGTQVWINQPPANLILSYPDGLPAAVTPNVATPFRVQVTASGSTPQPNTGEQFVSIDGGSFVQSGMTQVSPNLYQANLPAVPCTSQIRFYVSADTTTATTVTDPSSAPSTYFSALSSLGTQVLLDDHFETAVAGWTVTNSPGLTSGAWTRVDPVGTFFPDGSMTAAQPEDDFAQAGNETMCYVTQQSTNAIATDDDVDGGTTTLTSPVFNLSGTDAIVSYARWMFTTLGTTDSLLTQVTENGSAWTTVNSTTGTGGQWQVHSFKVSDFITPSATVQVRFQVGDADASVTEAGIDNFLVTKLLCGVPCSTPADCDDGQFCNGAEQCLASACEPGTNPCPGLCDEALDACVDCLVAGDCDDGLFCNGAETCTGGSCAAGSNPCTGLGLVCDEGLNACVGCLVNADCDDGLMCTGAEACIGNVCQQQVLGVTNGTFEGAGGWTVQNPNGGSATFGGTLVVVGNDIGEVIGPPATTWAGQTVDLGGANLQFDLVSYTTQDTGIFDFPIVVIDGMARGLNANGTLGAAFAPHTAGTAGTIANNNLATNVHFSVALSAGAHTIGLGVHSRDSGFGPGTATFDTVLPPGSPVDPCPGQFCDEALGCVACLLDAHCLSGQHCCEGSCTPTPCQLQLQPRTGDPLNNLTGPQMARFLAGQTDFNTVLNDAGGRGPIFNQNSCASCHNGSGIGGAGSITVARFGAAGKGTFDPLESLGGSLLQAQAISPGCAEVVPPQANVTALRLTNSTFGAGLVEAVPDADILALESSPPPGVSGKAHMTTPLEDPPGLPMRVGRFGWKAQVATVLTFSADASLNEMGFTNRLAPTENAPNGNAALLAMCDTVPDPEDGPDGSGLHFIDRITDFQRFLAQPPQTPKSGMTGETVFTNLGCANCHVPTFTTGAAADPVLSSKPIRPYSDFLLHDMAQLGDGIVQGPSTTTEMRTASLWGVRVRDPLLHDGRVAGGSFASRITQAINWHGMLGSESAASAAAYAALSTPDKNAVIAFLDSLGRAEFDHDGDDDVDAADFVTFRMCFGAGGMISPDDPCAISDIDQNGDVDLAVDFDFFLQAYDGVPADCNLNSVVDLADILLGTSEDVNNDAIPDSCQGCIDSADCNDSDPCTTDTCANTECAHGPVDCSALSDACNVGVCSIAGGGCVTEPANEGLSCNDAGVCTQDDACDAGACSGLATTYGDVNHDGFVNTDDALCLTDHFGGVPNSAPCQDPMGQVVSFESKDISPCPTAGDPTNMGDGFVNVGDVLAALDKFAGVEPAGCSCGP